VTEPTELNDSTADAFLGGALMLWQPKRGYRAGIDPVLLAASCKAEPGEQVLDCGAGVGTVGLCVARRITACSVTLVERSDAYVAFAARNITENNLAERVAIVAADLTLPLAQTALLHDRIGTFNHALANPPYQATQQGTRSAIALKDAANAMPEGSLDAWLRFMAAMLRPGGRATLIHRTVALPELLAALAGRFGAITIDPIQPQADASANRVIVSGVKNSRAPLQLRRGIILHQPDGTYRDEIDAILRGKHGLGHQI
jgi:tRNA1(Val) A37 N6-methylase TrmN6